MVRGWLKLSGLKTTHETDPGSCFVEVIVVTLSKMNTLTINTGFATANCHHISGTGL